MNLKNRILIVLLNLVVLSLLSHKLTGTGLPGPLADSIPKQHKDSVLLQLNLKYLNGVNDKSSPYQLIPILETILNLDPDQYNHWLNLGMERIKIREYDKALNALLKGLDLYPAPHNPSLVQVFVSISFCYNKLDDHRKEKEILDYASQHFPNHPEIIGRHMICSYSRSRFGEAESYQVRLIYSLRSKGSSESDIAFYLGRLYMSIEEVEAEKHFRIAYKYDPENMEKLGALAWVLIQDIMKIKEGMSLIEKAIEADSTNALFLHWQGYGFYLQGKYEDALFNLYNARDLYQQFNFEITEHIELVEEAIASREN